MQLQDIDRPLSDDDIVALGELLAAIPEENHPLDVALLDGYLVGVLLQPELVLPTQWLPYIFDENGKASAFPDLDAAQKAMGLIMRRYNELNACILAREPIDPIVFEVENEAGEPLSGKAGVVALAPWSMGFAIALEHFPALAAALDLDEALAGHVACILRHLPANPDADAADMQNYNELQQLIDGEAPLADLDEAIADLSLLVMDAAAVTRPSHPQTRTSPKVGRNDPCPCGSGRKYKTCHGKDIH